MPSRRCNLTCCLILVLAFHPNFGCAVNDVGLVERTYYTNGRDWAVGLRTFGAHLVTYKQDVGLTLGRSEKMYFFAGSEEDIPVGAAGEPSAADLEGLAIASRLVRTSGRPETLGRLVALAHHDAGVMLGASPYGIGLRIGLANRVAFAAPADADAVYIFCYDRADPANNRFLVLEAEP